MGSVGVTGLWERGSPYCESNRLHKKRLGERAADEAVKEYEYGDRV